MKVPFDAGRLDALMEAAGLEALLVTSKHNVQYLLGGHRAHFFHVMDAIGLSRYLPVLAYVRGAPERAAYFGARSEAAQFANEPIWVPQVEARFSTSIDVVEAASAYVRKLGLGAARIGIEPAFLPADSHAALRKALPDAALEDALVVLERLRMLKRPDELETLRAASELILDSMLAVVAGHGPGVTTRALTEALRREEVQRGLDFEYCLIATGSSHNRAPSNQRWEQGEVLSLDSGGNYQGYIGDLARMAILGKPDAELTDLLGQVESVQQAVIGRVEPGVRGGDLFEYAHAALSRGSIGNATRFVAHGMGMISHEGPRLTNTGPVPYPAEDADRPLQAGMVLSIETSLEHPKRGFIKLEDTVAVTATGRDVLGDYARGWNEGGAG